MSADLSAKALATVEALAKADSWSLIHTTGCGKSIFCDAGLTGENHHAKIPAMKLISKYGCIAAGGKEFP